MIQANANSVDSEYWTVNTTMNYFDKNEIEYSMKAPELNEILELFKVSQCRRRIEILHQSFPMDPNIENSEQWAVNTVRLFKVGWKWESELLISS